jgi:hypothetical protein
MKKILLVLSILIVNLNFSQTLKGDRILAWEIGEALGETYDSAFNLAQDMCLESVHLSMVWSSLDTNNGSFNNDFIANVLDVANIYYPIYGMKAEIQLAPINTNVKEFPKDLSGLSMNNLVVINRFKQTLDTFFTHLPNLELTALNIGNEHDIFMGTNPILYNEYKVFLDSVVPYAKQLYFNIHGDTLNVGTTFTLLNLINPSKAPLCQYVNNGLDIISTTYYPEGDTNFTASLIDINYHLDSLISLYSDTNQDIYIVECGFASSTYLGSSEYLQSSFFKNMFNSWDIHINRVKYLSIFKQTDWSQSDVNTLAQYYGLTDSSFTEFLGTLGLRKSDGTPKLAFETIKCELANRSWCSVVCNTTSRTEISSNNTIVFPNPASHNITIDTKEGIDKVSIVNMEGKIIYNAPFNKNIDVSVLPNGFYQLTLYTDLNELLHYKICIVK